MALRTEQPDYRDVVDILAAAIEGGINCIDTAAVYGESEELLGRALEELKAVDDVLVVTKVRFLEESELAEPTAAAKAIEDSIAESRRRLKIDCLPLVLFHREADAAYVDVLESLRERGWLKRFGVSCDNTPGPAAEFVRSGRVSALQLPGSVLDPRHLRSDVLEEAEQRNVAIFLRSAYLQGLLVMPCEQIPTPLRDVVPVRQRLDALASEAGMSIAELALRYALSLNGLTSVVVGVETVQQMRDNLAIFNRGPLPTDLLAAIDAAVPELPEFVITPKLSPKDG